VAIGDPYNNRADFKTALDITSTEEDAWIDKCLAAAATAINHRSGWGTFWNTGTPVTRRIPLLGKVRPVRTGYFQYDKVLLSQGICDATFTVAGTPAPILMPEEALELGQPADAIRLPWGFAQSRAGFLNVTAVWGWPEVPDDIIWAHHMQAHRYYGRKGSPEGIAGTAEWGLSRIPRLDPDVLSILKDGGYMRAGIG
jgi:hypothetical protein